MSVIIKGMEMPKRCGGCPLRGVCKERMYVEYRPKDCPLIELPFVEELAEKLYKQIEKAVIEAEGETDGR